MIKEFHLNLFHTFLGRLDHLQETIGEAIGTSLLLKPDSPTLLFIDLITLKSKHFMPI